jgi:type 1 glutamine amidotransferase
VSERIVAVFKPTTGLRRGESNMNVYIGRSPSERRRDEKRLGSLWGKALLCTALTWSLGAPAVMKATEAKGDGHVLIVTGEDYPGHKWKQTTPVLKEKIEQDDRLHVDVLQDLSKLAAARLVDYDAVVLHFKNYDPNSPGRAGLDNLLKYVEQGGGLVLVHFACGAFQEFHDDFERLAGRVWDPKLRGHDPRGTFRVDIVAGNHPVTRGMKAFATNDELYTCLTGDASITLLATADSQVDGKTYPLAFTLTPERGRVFHCVLGHDVEGLENDGAGELFRRGTAWAAGLNPEKRP